MGNSQISKKLKCKIINIEPDPKHPARTVVSLEISDGRGEPYIRAYSLLPPENPISLEKFSILLANKDLRRPTDPFHYLKEAKDDASVFDVFITDEGQNEE